MLFTSSFFCTLCSSWYPTFDEIWRGRNTDNWTADADATNSHGRDTSVKSKVQNLQNKIASSKKPLINKANIEQAKKFLSNGGLMKTLEDKYTITEEARTELVNE